jgi:hypothetical protein
MGRAASDGAMGFGGVGDVVVGMQLDASDKKKQKGQGTQYFKRFSQEISVCP